MSRTVEVRRIPHSLAPGMWIGGGGTAGATPCDHNPAFGRKVRAHVLVIDCTGPERLWVKISLGRNVWVGLSQALNVGWTKRP